MIKTKYEIIFSKNCIYKFNDVDDFDINKLFGISLGFHHKNSIRFGWNVDGEKIAIYTYCYKFGERFMDKIVSVSVEKKYTFEIKNFKESYDLKIINESGQIVGWANIFKPETPNWGYRLFPYFGGNKTAPHDMEIKMKKIY